MTSAPLGGGAVSEMLTKPDMGGGGIRPMMMSAKKKGYFAAIATNK